MRKLTIILSIVLLTAYAAFSTKAFADFSTAFVQITCSKDLGYFSIKTFSLWDVNEDADPPNGLYSAQSVTRLKKPLSCNLNGHHFSVSISDSVRPLSMACAGADDGSVLVSLDGKFLGRLPIISGCWDVDTTRAAIYVSDLGGLFDVEQCGERSEKRVTPKADPDKSHHRHRTSHELNPDFKIVLGPDDLALEEGCKKFSISK